MNGFKNMETWLVKTHFDINTKEELANVKDALPYMKNSLPPFFRNYIDLGLIDWEELEKSII
jgi:hypothetical protein